MIPGCLHLPAIWYPLPGLVVLVVVSLGHDFCLLRQGVWIQVGRAWT
jgi:hypothetical protein